MVASYLTYTLPKHSQSENTWIPRWSDLVQRAIIGCCCIYLGGFVFPFPLFLSFSFCLFILPILSISFCAPLPTV
ncbi:hypothetical protein BDV24DRAFT_128796 [Aspergillus arachidicola]|uniref:Uncharacterized protein n=1 Tax=Aspergillus arachidicola TaxID=656916 RepID=A0A5N6YGP9_9EURO|nr:hypothetical protein BDV24DRAFT_128796 [Aspergillus arachidicola]